MKRILVIVIIIVSWMSTMTSQDLIERTKADIRLKNLIPIKPIGKSIMSYTWPKSSLSLFELHKTKKSNDYFEFTDRAVYLTINKKVLFNSFKSTDDIVRISVPVSSKKSFELILEPVELLARDYRLETSHGEVYYPDRSKFRFYRGIVSDDPNSLVTVSIVNGRFRAVISDNHGNYNLGELPKEPGVFTLFNDRSLKVSLGKFCQTKESEVKNKILDISENTNKSSGNSCVPIYVEADYAMFQSHGEIIEDVESFIASLVSEVASIYSNNTGLGGADASINISLSQIRVLTSLEDDPYDGINNIFSVLQKFGEERQNLTDGRLKHLISTRALGGGIAWLNVLCSNYDSDDDSGPFAVSADMITSVEEYPIYSWESYVFAHEMGHNFGSPHTQSCSWDGGPLDNCYETENGNCSNLGPDPGNVGGTIMSYCHICANWQPNQCGVDFPNENRSCDDLIPNCPNPGINLSVGFGPQPGQLIYDKYVSGIMNMSCLLECAPTHSCSDGMLNGDETGVDCGGPDCDPCPTCIDNIQNQGEVAVDCGGPCDACVYGCNSDMNAHNYELNPDIEETCQTCSDNILNGDEEGVDCGGSNPVCVACPCLEVFASNYNMLGPCVYDCDASSTSLITDSNANSTIKSGANTMSTDDMSPVDVDMVGPFYWRARQSIELNGGFTIQAGSSLTIDVGDCNEPE